MSRIRFRPFLILCGVLAFGMPAYGDMIVDDPDCQRLKEQSMNERLSGADVDFRVVDFQRLLSTDRDRSEVVGVDVELYLVPIKFGITDTKGTISYLCKYAPTATPFPAYAGFSWLLVMPSQSTFSLIRQRASDGFFTDTTIRSHLDDRYGDRGRSSFGALRVLVSGPFWRLGRRGELPIGALVRGNVLEQEFRSDFSAKHVLCSKDGSIDLIDGRAVEPAKMVEFNKNIAEKCEAAIQVGPALFEQVPEPGYPAKQGIGSSSMHRARRNILIRTTENLILFSTLFDIASYDAMIASELLVRKREKYGKILWAVGLVDDESLSGPVLVVDGKPVLELTEASRPTGAVMEFIF